MGPFCVVVDPRVSKAVLGLVASCLSLDWHAITRSQGGRGENSQDDALTLSCLLLSPSPPGIVENELRPSHIVSAASIVIP